MSSRTTKSAAVLAALAVLLVATAAPQPASAQRLERLEIEARTLLVEALRSHERARETDDPAERLALLRATVRALARIEDEFAISDTGIKLLTGESFGQLVPSRLAAELDSARAAVMGSLPSGGPGAAFVNDCTRGLSTQADIPDVAELCGCIFNAAEDDIPIDRLALVGQLFDRDVPGMAAALVESGLPSTTANQTTNMIEGAAMACFAARQEQ